MLSKSLRLTHDDRILLAEAFFWLSLIRAGLKVVKFHNLCNLLPILSTQMHDSRREDLSVDRIVWAVKVASRYVRAICLPQALAAQILLARRGLPSKLYIGVRRAPGGRSSAHAWLEYQGRVAIGGDAYISSYVVIYVSEYPNRSISLA
jgi:hypothetical protein